MPVRWVKDVRGFYNFIAYVVLHAPNRFPKEDYLADHEQMTLEKAFEELRTGIRLVEKDFPGADGARGLSAILDEALSLYENGDVVGGAHRLQDLESLIFKSNA